MSKTERDLAGDSVADALDEIFDDTDFDDALDDALGEADDSVPIRRRDDAESTDADEPVDSSDDERSDDATGELASEVDDRGDDATGELASEVDDRGDDVTGELVSDVDDRVDGDSGPTVDHDAEAELDPDASAADDDDSDDSDGYEMPEIVPATPDGAADDTGDHPVDAHDVEAFVEPRIDDDDLDDDEVAEEILEELRRADIDGPQVEMAPQDENTAARRRPRRAVDYDPAPVPIPARVPRVLGRKPRVRRVTRVVRHVDPWSVFKIAIVANLVLYITLLTSGVLLWNVAHATGTVDNVERFFESFGWESFEFKGGEIYHAAWIAGLFGVIGLTGFAVLLATLFNLITDLVGGVRFTVLEEEVIETRTSPLRRFVVRRPEPDVPATVHDASGAMVREAVVDDTGANARPSR